MTQPLFGAMVPITLRHLLPELPRRLRETFGIKTVSHDRKSFLNSPGASLLGWSPDVPPEITALRCNDPERLPALAQALVEHVEQMSPDDAARAGEVHILDSEGSHSYVYLSPWHEGVSATPGDLTEFHGLMHCFPSAQGTLQDHRLVNAPGVLGWLTGGDEQREQQLRFDAIEAYRKQQWTDPDAVLGPYFRLGVSSIIRVERYSEVLDEKRQRLIRCGTMGTTDFHVFDGRYTWIVVTDLANNRAFVAGIGGGRHPIREMDRVNPIGGAAVLYTTFESWLLARKHGLDLSHDAKSQLDALAARHDRGLALRRFFLAEGDAWGVGVAVNRQRLGSNLKAEDEEHGQLLTDE